eukprot:gene4948-8728_t
MSFFICRSLLWSSVAAGVSITAPVNNNQAGNILFKRISSAEEHTTTQFNEEEMSEKQHAVDSKVLLLVLALLFLTSLVIWKFKVKRYAFIHETGVSLIIGLLAGYLVDRYTEHGKKDVMCSSAVNPNPSVEKEAVFDPEIFFYMLLPPIMFYAGYDMKQRQFFRNIGTILLYAFVGTTIVCFSTGFVRYMSRFLFLLLVAVTVLAIFHDLHVDERLHALVFGESALNDAVAIILYRYDTQSTQLASQPTLTSAPSSSSIDEYQTGPGVSITPGRVAYSIWAFMRFPLLETTIFVLLSYASFVTGEALSLSGI